MQQVHAMIHKLHNPDAGKLLIRIALGLVFINAGWLKMANMELTVQFFQAAGIIPFLAYFVTYAEFICGIAMILGVFVRYAGILLAAIMFVAVWLVFGNGFSLANGGYEYTLVLMLASLAMVTLGSGKYSLAHMMKKNKEKVS